MIIITLEGNIGAGKTTLATALYEEFKKIGVKTVHIKEPVGLWTNFHGKNLLDRLYSDIQRWAFTFQVNALMDMTDYDRQAIKLAREGNVVIKERSSFSVRHIFSEHLKDHMSDESEYKILTKLNDTIRDPHEKAAAGDGGKGKPTPPLITLYVRTEPETCFDRVLRRGRWEEVDGGLNLEYLEKLHEKHEGVAQKFHGRTIVVDNTRSNTTCDPCSIKIGDEYLFDVLTAELRRSERH